MASEISSRAACLAELISNPKSFFNCPDMHGGSGSSEGRFNSETLKSGIMPLCGKQQSWEQVG